MLGEKPEQRPHETAFRVLGSDEILVSKHEYRCMGDTGISVRWSSEYGGVLPWGEWERLVEFVKTIRRS